MQDKDHRAGPGSNRLKEELRELAKFPDENPNPVLRIARNGRILYANAASEPILRTFDREVGQSLPEDWARQVAAASDSSPQQEVDLKVGQRVFAVALTPVAGANYVNVYARDITKRKRVEQELRDYQERLEELVRKRTSDLEQSEARAQLLEQLATMGNLAKTSDEVLLAAITAIARHTNWPVAHVYKADAEARRAAPTDLWYLRDPRRFQPFREITLWTSSKAGAGLPGRVLAAGKPCWIEDVTKDGSFARARKGADLGVRGAVGFPVMLNGKAAMILEFFTEAPVAPDRKLLTLLEQIGVQLSAVIERRQAEESHARLTAIIEATSDFVAIADARGNVLYCNRGARKLLGVGEEEDISGLRVADTHPAATAAVILNEGLPTAARVGEWRGETSFLARDGRETPVSQVILAHKSPEGMVRHFSTIARDITERKRAEQEMERSKEAAEAASRAKSDFLANMSHELRTPLNAIIGFSEILQDLTFGPLNPKQSRYVDNVLTSGRHLLNLINDILDLSKIEAGKMKLEPAPFRVKGAIEDALVLVKEKALKHGLDLVLDAADNLTITADERKFKQIMFNLLSNATKFTPDGGRITVAAERCAKNVQISVTDTGIGIKPEDQPRLFHEFQQLDTSLARKHEGTGLGLALSRKFVELHGGRIWVESPGAGKGSAFRFVLPLEQPGVRLRPLERIEWTADVFGVGVGLFNRQHQRLCGMINMLIEGQGTNSNQDFVTRILNFMVEYAAEHFRDEEQLMSQYAYPDLDEHVRQHRAFVVKTAELLTAAKQGDEALPDKVLEFLRYWLTHHILGVDMKYKAFFGAKGVS